MADLVEQKKIYAHIKAARLLLAGVPVSVASTKTLVDYAQKYTSLAGRPGGVWAAVADTQKTATYFARRAAVLHCTREKIAALLSEQDALQRQIKTALTRDAHTIVYAAWVKKCGELSSHMAVLESVPTGHAPIDRVQRTTKRRIGNAPPDWREKIAARMVKWKPHYLVAAVTGCRPSELCTGVELVVQGDFLLAQVHGAKVTAKSGQKVRVLAWPVSHPAPLVQQLLDLVDAAPGQRLTVKIDGTTKNPGAIFSNAIRDAGKRECPGLTKTLTAYSLRHALASDLKASNCTAEQISAALGHLSIDTQSSYGHSNAARGASLAPQSTHGTQQIKGQLKARPQSRHSDYQRQR